MKVLERQVNMCNNLFLSKICSPELYTLTITQHFFSPWAYTYIRQKFDSSLIHPKKSVKWYRIENEEPGSSSEALDSIKRRAARTDHKQCWNKISDFWRNANQFYNGNNLSRFDLYTTFFTQKVFFTVYIKIYFN